MRADSILMKELNKEAVRRELRRLRRATKQELSAGTGLSIVTVNALVEEMASQGEVLAGHTVPSGGGRPSHQYIYNASYQLAVIIYGHQRREKTETALAVVNLFGECLERRHRNMEEVKTDSFDEWLDEAFKKYPSIRLIAFGLPGQEQDGVILLNDYPALVGDGFLRHYRERYGLPAVFENDVNASILGRYSRLDGGSVENVVGIYFPRIYAPGAGAVIHGELYHGARNFAGELQYLELPYSWEHMDYENTEALAQNIGRMLLMYGCMLAPDIIVLYGDFWTEENREAVASFAGRRLGTAKTFRLVFEESIAEDFERGMIKLALDRLDSERKLL